MKKIIIIAAAAMLVVASLVSGVFALYKNELDDVAGDVEAKNFVFVGEVEHRFGSNIGIAPAESYDCEFSISNFSAVNGRSEVDIDVRIVVEFNSEILPLVIALMDTDTGIEAISATREKVSAFEFSLSASENQTRRFLITVEWPKDSSDYAGKPVDDNQYIGKTASFIVKASGVQKV